MLLVLPIFLLALVAAIVYLIDHSEVPERVRPPRAEPIDFGAELRRLGPLARRYPVGPTRSEER